MFFNCTGGWTNFNDLQGTHQGKPYMHHSFTRVGRQTTKALKVNNISLPTTVQYSTLELVEKWHYTSLTVITQKFTKLWKEVKC